MLPIFSAMGYFALLARKWPFYKDICVWFFYEIFVFSSKYKNLRKAYLKKNLKNKTKKTLKYKYVQKCCPFVIRLVVDQNPPVHLVSESRGGRGVA